MIMMIADLDLLSPAGMQGHMGRMFAAAAMVTPAHAYAPAGRHPFINLPQIFQNCQFCEPDLSRLSCCRIGAALTPQREALKQASFQRSVSRGPHDSTDANCVRRFTCVPEPATHEPCKDSFRTRSFIRTGAWH